MSERDGFLQQKPGFAGAMKGWLRDALPRHFRRYRALAFSLAVFLPAMAVML